MTGGQYILIHIIMVVCSAALMMLEAFIPGVSLAGIAAVALIVWNTYLCWNAFGPLAGIILFLASAALSAISMQLVLRSLKKGKLSKTDLFLNTENSPVVPVPTQQTSIAPGAVGVAVTALHPSGIAEIGGERIHVSCENCFIAAGAVIRVIKTEGTRILVGPHSSEDS